MSPLALARKLTVPLRRLPGTYPPIELVRRCAYGRGVQTVVDFDGNQTITVDLAEHMGSQIFWFGYYSRDVVCVLDSLLGPGQTFIDAGANVGEITLVAAKRVGESGHVVSFEPVGEVRERLAFNVRANAWAQVEIIGAGLSDRTGRLPIYVSRNSYDDGSNHTGLATLYASQERSEIVSEVDLTTLDRVVSDRGLERIDGIKLDIEGAELDAIRGAAETLRRFRPWLVVEVGRDTCQAAGYEPDDILMALDGYSFARIGRKGRLDPVEAGELGPWQNLLCQPLR